MVKENYQQTMVLHKPSPSQDATIDATGTHTIGEIKYAGSPSLYFDGTLSHVNFIDGTAYQASTFGSTDATTGIWKINTNPTVTYGTNGFFLKWKIQAIWI